MSNVNKPIQADIEIVVRAFRNRLETADHSKLHEVFKSFPRGSCGAASDVLSTLLERRFEIKPKIARAWLDHNGERWSHGWLETQGLTIDVTADQFGQEAVIVSRSSWWHAQLKDVERARFEFDGAWWGMVGASVWPLVSDLANAPS